MKAPTSVSQSKAEFQKAPECRNHALFMHSFAGAGPVFLMIFLHIAAIALTNFIRLITPVAARPQVATPAENDVEATAIPTVAIGGEDEEETAADVPPPYIAASRTTPTSAPVSEQQTHNKFKHGSASNFVFGTGLFATLVAVLLLLALDIGSLIYCQPFSIQDPFVQVVLWALYSLQCMWCSTGAACWAILLRELWGPKMRKKYPIKEGSLLLWAVAVPLAPIVMLGASCITAIEWCQRKFCADALDEEREAISQGLELQAGMTTNAGEETERNSSEEEESVGLMTALK